MTPRAPSIVRRGRFALALVLVLAAAAPAARADVGDGLKVGPGRLKLGFEAGARYDSLAAVGIVGSPSAQATDPGDGIGLLRGTFELDASGESSKVNLTGNFDWNQYLSTQADLSAFSFWSSNVQGTAQLNPDGALGLDLTETFNRSDRTDNPLFGVGVLGLQNATDVRVRGRPGGGAIEIGVDGGFGADIYSAQPGVTVNDNYTACEADPTCNPAFASAYNALAPKVGLDAKWRLFPKTGFTLQATYGWTWYVYGSSNAGTQAANPLQIVAGFGTLLSTRFTFALRAGYGGIFFSQAPMLNDFIGQAEVGYRVSETLSTRLGFQRTNQPIAGATLYFDDNRVYWELRGEFNRLDLLADASLDLIGYGSATTAPNPRQDQALTGSVEADYHLTRWLKLTTRLDLSTRSVSNAPVVSQVLAYDYSRWQLGAGLATTF